MDTEAKLSFQIRKLVTLLFLILLACSKDAVDTIDTIEQFTLSVSSGQGGSVNNVDGTYNSGTQVTITATPEDGYEFTGWV